ncbi:hypothetical protein [Nocardia huaxiensis]|uniref:Hemophore-related protein n=1 Tax=Nocardia huaxiensis TaxID=2755382 RepID=A0A7D6VFQ4_9NOCA|nr:hypothetical protein [Nocardia huaxiensis]QLY33382.1 hypothetical protein H0264_15130 [Nocardia huaxiensis]
MRKTLTATLAAAGATAALLILPTGTANAMTPACQSAVDILHSYGSLGPHGAEMTDAAARLRTVEATGDEATYIESYARALDSGDVAAVGQAATLLSGICTR